MKKHSKRLILAITLISIALNAWAFEDAANEPLSAQVNQVAVLAPATDYENPLRYILGPDDVVQIDVMRHPEFSGVYPINLEGKIQYKFVGDIEVEGLTKKELESRITSIIANFVVTPEITVTILEYKSKVIYVLGEVAQPGKYYMRSDTIPVREAVVQAGLPLQSAAMRKCRIVSPDKNGQVKVRHVNLYDVLYGGNLRRNVERFRRL